MKKMILVVMMAVVAFSAMAQDSKPVTVEAVAVSGGGYGLGAGFVFPFDTMSIEPNLAVVTSDGLLGGCLGVKYYPFNASGSGLFTGLGFSIVGLENSLGYNTTGVVGYRFNFFKIMTAHLGVGGMYEFGETRNSFGVGMDIGLGFRF